MKILAASSNAKDGRIALKDDINRKYGEQVNFYKALVTKTLVANTVTALLTSVAGDGTSATDGIFSGTVVDGTNKTAVAEWQVSKNEFVAATGANAGLSVRFIRTSTDSLANHIDGVITENAQVSIPVEATWSSKGIYVVATQNGTYQFTILLAYYTPYTPA